MFTRLSDVVARVAARVPDRVAVEMGEVRLTYGELGERSEQYARALRRQGVAAGAVVAVSLSRTPHLVPVLLGILRSGAAYLPIDPDFPQDRQRYMLDDGGATLHLTDANWTSLLEAPAAVTADDPGAAPPDTADEAGATLAYVIYTSGSTGRPKGVEIPHRALSAFAQAIAGSPGMRERDRVLAHTTLSFDIHVLELLVPLTVGATVVLTSRETAGDPAALAACIDASGVTIVQATPAMWALLLRAGWRQGAGITALSGGEALPRDLADAILATGADLWNLYGPTETTVWSSVSHVAASGPIVIGEPLPGTSLHVLSDALVEQPPNEVGELCIGGVGLARGYRGRPDLTRERFVTLPPPDGRRVYRTGDLARRRPDGSIECLGRLDQQVKVGGNRIEPGEIESALRLVPGIEDAIVIAAAGPLGLSQLVAYVVGAPDATTNVAALRRALGERLPDYMVPSLYVPIAALPLTPNGKVDRAALPPPVIAAVDTTPPATDIERALHEIWCTVLGRRHVGVLENFFDAGGHSRLAAWLLALVADRLDARLPLSQLLSAPTIRQLAAVIASSGGGLSGDPVVRLTPAPLANDAARLPRTLYLAHAAGGHAIIYRDLARHLAGTCEVCVFQSRGLADEGAAPHTTVREMARDYIRQMRTLQPAGPYAIGGASFGGVIAWEMATQLRDAGAEVDLLLLIDSAYPPVAGGASGLLERLAAVPGFEPRVYPLLRRAVAHAAALRRLGPRRYGQWLLRDREAMRLAGDQRMTQQAGPLGRSVLDTLARIRDTNERALANYIPRRYDGPALFARARDGRDEHDTRDGWAAIGPRLTRVEVPGNHGTCLLAPHVAVIATLVRDALLRPGSAAASSATPLPLPPHRPRRVPA